MGSEVVLAFLHGYLALENEIPVARLVMAGTELSSGMPTRESIHGVVSSEAARALLLDGLELAGAAAPQNKLASVSRATLGVIEKIGFVQVDSINVVERAHHQILWTRVPGYVPSVLDKLHKEAHVFEQWTHDASIIPSRWFPHWRHRFGRPAWNAWIRQKLGKDAGRVIESVRKRLEAEGPLMSKDFEGDGRKAGGWWDWKPSKAALEHLWRAGEISVHSRVNFHKVYDLTQRVLPKVYGLAMPSEEEHVEWACRTAMERLGAATPREVAQFWNAIDQKNAATWCEAAAASGEMVRVTLGTLDGSKAKSGYAFADWREKARAAKERLASMKSGGVGLRLLSPFDPLVRDRTRCKRLFNFAYNFEAFVPEKKRKYGYYVLPILDGDRLIGRLDPKADRERGVLIVKGVWWESGVRETKVLRRCLDEVLEKYAAFNGVGGVEFAPSFRAQGRKPPVRFGRSTLD